MRASALDAVRTSAVNVTQYIFYEFTTLVQLSKVLSDMIQAPNAVQVGEPQDKGVAIEKLIADYAKGINIRNSPAIPFVPEDAVVLVTGSTGSIGSFLLADLLASPLVRRVYALNRFSSNGTSRSRQQAAFKDRGLDISLLESSKCKFLEADMSQDKLGLSSPDYQEVSISFLGENSWTDAFATARRFCDRDHSQRLASRFQPTCLVVCAQPQSHMRPHQSLQRRVVFTADHIYIICGFSAVLEKRARTMSRDALH
jgi:hypothetical protein